MPRSGDGGASDEDDRSKKGKSTDKRGSQSGTRQSNAKSSMHGQKSEEDYNRSPTFDTSSTSSTSFLGTKSRKLMSQKHFIREASPLGVEGSISESVQTTFRLNPAVKKLRGMSVIQADTTNANTLVVNVNESKGLEQPSDEDTSLGRRKFHSESKSSSTSSGILTLFSPVSEVECCGLFSCLRKKRNNSQSISSDQLPSTSSELDSRSTTNKSTERMVTRNMYKIPPKKCRWWQVTLYIINDVVGAWLLLYGSLMLGMYGWVLGLIILILVYPANLYTAHLLWRCRNVFPGAISIGDLVYYLSRSPLAMYFVMFIVNFTILLNLSSQIEVAASNIYWFFSDTQDLINGKCWVAFSTMICVVLLPLTQMRYLHSLTLVNLINMICMVLFLCVSVYMLIDKGVVEGTETHLGPDADAIKGFVASDSENLTGPVLGIELVFGAYFYQTIILEIMAEMKDPAEFPKANYWSTPFVIAVTVTASVTQYYFQGRNEEIMDISVQRVLTSLFSHSNTDRSVLAHIAVISFTLHMVGCCVVRSVIITRSVQLILNPKDSHKNSWRARLEWIGISVLVLTLAWTLTLFVNNLGMMSVVLGFLAILTSILLPIVLYIVMCKKRATLKSIPKLECLLMIVIVLFALAVLIANLIKMGVKLEENHGRSIRNVTITEFDNMFQCSDFNFKPYDF